jgi:hypothetical protein
MTIKPVVDRDAFDTFKEWLTLAATMVVLVTFIGGLGMWLTGGLRPQNQVATDILTDKVTAIQKTVSSIQDQLGVMPRPSDYLAHERHLAALDGQISAMSDRITRDEISLGRDEALMQGGNQGVHH